MRRRLVIIGGGPAGYAAALVAARAGVRDALLVERGALGGTCTNRGCIPTKFLLARSAELAAGGAGIGAPEWGRLIAHKNALVQGLARSVESRCRELGIEIVRGEGRLEGPRAVRVAGADGSSRVVEAERIILAPGSEPARPGRWACDGVNVITSDEALELREPPESLAIIGAGPVGTEFATIFRRCGARVVLLEAADRLFPREDPLVHDFFLGKFNRLGIETRTGDPVASLEIRGSGSVVTRLRSGETLETQRVLLGAGRRLLSAGLGLEAAGVGVGAGGEILVDEDQRTSQPHVFAAGDVTGRMLLAHVATCEGGLAARRALGLEGRAVPYRAVPWATYTSPEVASVGLVAEAAARAGLETATAVVPLMGNAKARIDRQTEGFAKVVVARASGAVVGGTIVGPQASDLVHVLALAIANGMTARDLAAFPFAHPSHAEIFLDACERLAP